MAVQFELMGRPGEVCALGRRQFSADQGGVLVEFERSECDNGCKRLYSSPHTDTPTIFSPQHYRDICVRDVDPDDPVVRPYRRFACDYGKLALNRAREHAGLAPLRLTPHSVRITAAVMAVENGADPACLRDYDC
jgi:hypothetical protein